MLVGFVNSELQVTLCKRCAKARGIVQSVLDADGISWEWWAIEDTEESEHLPSCDDCGYSIPSKLTDAGRRILVRDRFSIEYFSDLDLEVENQKREDWDGLEAGWYFVYGSFHDHDADSWFGPYGSEEGAIFEASEDYLENMVEYA